MLRKIFYTSNACNKKWHHIIEYNPPLLIRSRNYLFCYYQLDFNFIKTSYFYITQYVSISTVFIILQNMYKSPRFNSYLTGGLKWFLKFEVQTYLIGEVQNILNLKCNNLLCLVYLSIIHRVMFQTSSSKL